MKISTLGVCLVLSAALNLIGFAPVLTFVMGGSQSSSPPQAQSIRVRLLNRQLEPQHQSAVESHPAVAQTRRPQIVPRVAQARPAPAQVPPPRARQIPDDGVPKARPQRHRSRPAGHAQQPPPPSEAPVSFTPPPASFPPPPSSPTPSDSPTPLSAESSSQPPPPPPPASGGDQPDRGTIPDKPARPLGSPPKSLSEPVLRRLGGQHKIQLTVKIHPDGHIEARVLVSSGSEELDAAVLKEIQGWKWEPAEVAGKPVPSERAVRLKLEHD